jgi:hypothetical protein
MPADDTWRQSHAQNVSIGTISPPTPKSKLFLPTPPHSVPIRTVPSINILFTNITDAASFLCHFSSSTGSSSHIEILDENQGGSISKYERQDSKKNKGPTAEPHAKLTLHHGDPALMMSTFMNNKHSNNCHRNRIKWSQWTSNYGLVDRGGNGGYCGSEDTRLISLNSNQYCFVDGVEKLNAGKCPLGTFGSATRTHKGPVVIIVNQYAKGKQQK